MEAGFRTRYRLAKVVWRGTQLKQCPQQYKVAEYLWHPFGRAPPMAATAAHRTLSHLPLLWPAPQAGSDMSDHLFTQAVFPTTKAPTHPHPPGTAADGGRAAHWGLSPSGANTTVGSFSPSRLPHRPSTCLQLTTLRLLRLYCTVECPPAGGSSCPGLPAVHRQGFQACCRRHLWRMPQHERHRHDPDAA